jgi:GPH family glycoside/pentoside/hexuronide:cation symporter
MKTKLAFGAGSLVDNLTGNSIHQLANPVYNIALGVNPALIGTVLAIGRLLDAVTDPIIGNISDNFRSRHGRRRPLIVAGALLTGPILLAMFCIPRGWSPGAYGFYFAAAMLLFYPAFTLYSVPLKGFQYELTADYHERTRVAAVVAFLMPLGGILASWLFALTQLSVFKDTIEGARYTGLAVLVIIAGVGVLPVLFAREKAYDGARSQPKVKLLGNVWGLLKNRPLRLLSLAGLSTLLGIFTVYSLGSYLNIYHVHGGDLKTASVLHGAVTSAYQVASMASVPVIAWAATRLGKRRAFLICLCIALVGTVAKWFCYVPGSPGLMFIPMILMGIGMSGFWVLLASMMADVTDHAELLQGYRNEASVGAVFSWINKSGMSLAFMVSGFVLVWVGFDEKLGGAQAPGTLFWMRVLFSFVPAVALVVAILCVRLYPITEETARDTREALARRHAAQ